MEYLILVPEMSNIVLFYIYLVQELKYISQTLGDLHGLWEKILKNNRARTHVLMLISKKTNKIQIKRYNKEIFYNFQVFLSPFDNKIIMIFG